LGEMGEEKKGVGDRLRRKEENIGFVTKKWTGAKKSSFILIPTLNKTQTGKKKKKGWGGAS